MPVQSIFNFDKQLDAGKPDKAKTVKKKSPSKKNENRGCDFCPLNKIEGLHKIKNLDKIEGKKVMVWAQNPGYEENKQRKELVGNAGKFLWGHAAAMGLKREDCDIQNVVRCFPVDVDPDTDGWIHRHTPSKEEINCCSIYTEQALEKVYEKTKVHLVFGAIAAKALLKGEFRKDQKTFYSEKLKAWVILTYHPSYFLRGAPRAKLDEFKQAIALAVSKTKSGTSGQFAYIKAQDYKSVKTNDIEEELEKPILAAAAKGIVITVDIEDGVNDLGENVITYIGFSWKKGHSRGLWLAHKDLVLGTNKLKLKLEFIQRILEDENILKAMQNGVYDVWKLRKLLKIKVRGFVHDTFLSEYLRFSGRKAYGLEMTADVRFREFAGYKGLLDPHIEKGKKRPNFYTVPMDVEVMYNGADCDLTKRIQVSNKGKVNEALLKMLMKVAPVLARMERRGPLMDYEHYQLLEKWIPIRLERLGKQIKDIAKNPNFNPNKPADVAHVVYDMLKLGKHLDDEMREESPRSTKKEFMALLGDYHIFPRLMSEYRALAKKKSTYMEGYKTSADMHDGRVTTKWWLTGAITGRLRSGGEKGNKKEKGIVNLQNIHGEASIECLLVSDLNWRDLYNDYKQERKRDKERAEQES